MCAKMHLKIEKSFEKSLNLLLYAIFSFNQQYVLNLIAFADNFNYPLIMIAKQDFFHSSRYVAIYL